ncbi:MAG: rubrerythrin family protein [Haloarculaceae archaeon]
MDADTFLEDVREENRTPLSRLGSSKSLYADTRGEMDEGPMRAAAVARERGVAAVFDDWRDDPVAGDLFGDAADAAGDRADALDAAAADWSPAVHDALADLEGSVERLGGFVGWALADGRNKGQLTGFFTGQADPGTASTFREARDAVEDQRDRALALLTEACGDEADWERAREAAAAVVEADYDEYFETLEDLGVSPKPVC